MVGVQAAENRLQVGAGGTMPGTHLHSLTPVHTCTPPQARADSKCRTSLILRASGLAAILPAQPADGSVPHILLEPATISSGTHTQVTDWLDRKGGKTSLLCSPGSEGREPEGITEEGQMHSVCREVGDTLI